jgi:hypothetical protein
MTESFFLFLTFLTIVKGAKKKTKEEEELEAERLAAEKKKKKPIRYPTEDLDVHVTEKDIKAGMRLDRPIPDVRMSFAQPSFELFLMSWNFLVVHGYVAYYLLRSSDLRTPQTTTPPVLIHS